MRHTDTIIIGGGQAGLAMSRSLMDRGVDHVVLERGRTAERWRSERWDSLRLLTPNWQSRLPQWRYRGSDPDGFMGRDDVVAYLEAYARSFAAPVEHETTVLSVRLGAGGYSVATDRGDWQSESVVVATGHAAEPRVPDFARELDPAIYQLTPARYRRPDDLPQGGVLVVGASATGVQLAAEIHASGRPVSLAVGRHIRMPRHYRGRDIMWWLDRAGVLDETPAQVPDIEASRGQPSMQLVGTSDHQSLDLGVLQARGIRLFGRALAADGARVQLSTDLPRAIRHADEKLARLLDRIDGFACVFDDLEGHAPERPARIAVPATPAALDLRALGITAVMWATGFRRSYPWLQVGVGDARGEIVHRGGVTAAPGLYVLGLHFLRRRKSSFIDGVGADAAELADHIATYLGAPQSAGMSLTALSPGGIAMNHLPFRAKRYDAVVVGARCAGAATAMLLAQSGMSVLVVDRGRFGSDTRSTHALMRGAVMQLQHWGELEPLVDAGTPAVRRVSFHYGDEERVFDIKPSDGIDALYAPRRALLDAQLVTAARRAGAEVHHRMNLHALLHRGERVSGVTIETSEGRIAHIEADIVIGADGVGSTVARLAGARNVVTAGNAGAVLYGYWPGLHQDGYHWHYVRGVGAGVIPTNDGLSCVFVGCDPDRFRRELQRGAPAAFTALLTEAAPELGRRLADVRSAEPLTGFSGIAGFVREASGPGWALVGDAGYFKDPITAHGITDALRDAELAARALVDGGERALAEYQRMRDELSLPLFWVSDAIASYDWDLARVQQLHVELSEAMKAEVAALRELHRAPVGNAPLAKVS